jgi:small subunit ribosomal protein S20
MPVIHKSTIRRARQSERRRQRNRATVSAVKSMVKKVQEALDTNNAGDARTSLREATAALAKAVTKGVMKPNTASRRISRLTRRVNALTVSHS